MSWFAEETVDDPLLCETHHQGFEYVVGACLLCKSTLLLLEKPIQHCALRHVQAGM